jgi:hypothetical protein
MSHQTTQKEKRERLVLVNHPPSPDQALVNSALTGAITWISISGSRAGLYKHHLDPSPCNPNPKPHHSPIHLHSAVTNHRESRERYLLRVASSQQQLLPPSEIHQFATGFRFLERERKLARD